MSDLKVGTGPSGGYSPGSYWKEGKLGRVDITSEENLQKWSEVLGISKKELIQAASDFGPLIRDIRRGLMANDEAA